MTLTYEQVRELTSFTSESTPKMLKLNDRYICRFIIPARIQDFETYHFWSEGYVEENAAARLMREADFDVFDSVDYHHFFGRLILSDDTDLNHDGYYSLTLYLRDAEIYERDPRPKTRYVRSGDSAEPIAEPIQYETKKWKTMISIVDYKLADDEFVELPEFMKLLHKKPCLDINQLVDDLDEGWVLVEFPRYKNCTASIEYSVNPEKQNLYFEIIDWNGYVDGTFIELDSPRRRNVINYAPLTQKTKDDLAQQINTALDELYND